MFHEVYLSSVLSKFEECPTNIDAFDNFKNGNSKQCINAWIKEFSFVGRG